MTGRQTNWAGNVVYRAHQVSQPSSLAELRELLQASSQARVLGTGHSFNRIADTPGLLVSLAGLPPVIDIDPGRSVVSVGGGVTYEALAPELSRAGFALPTLASLPRLSVAGACATASHGSGDGNGNLATSVSEMAGFAPAPGRAPLYFRRSARSLRGTGLLASLGGRFHGSDRGYGSCHAFQLLSGAIGGKSMPF